MISDAEWPSSCSWRNSTSSETSLAPRPVGKRRTTESDRDGSGLVGTQNGTTEDLVSLEALSDTRRGQEVINTIASGFTRGDSSNSARKKHLHAVHQVNLVSVRPRMPPITFTDKDFKGIDPTQDDLMVISVDIDNFTIKKAF